MTIFHFFPAGPRGENLYVKSMPASNTYLAKAELHPDDSASTMFVGTAKACYRVNASLSRWLNRQAKQGLGKLSLRSFCYPAIARHS